MPDCSARWQNKNSLVPDFSPNRRNSRVGARETPIKSTQTAPNKGTRASSEREMARNARMATQGNAPNSEEIRAS